MGFWEEKLGTGAAPPPPPQRPVYGPGVVPAGMGQNPQQAVNHYLAQRGIAPVADPSIDTSNMEGYLAAHKNDPVPATDTCPRCGSFRYVVPRNAGLRTNSGTAHPASYCGECGYNELHPDQGSLANGAKTIGDPGKARQGRMMEPSWTPMKVSNAN